MKIKKVKLYSVVNNLCRGQTQQPAAQPAPKPNANWVQF